MSFQALTERLRADVGRWGLWLLPGPRRRTPAVWNVTFIYLFIYFPAFSRPIQWSGRGEMGSPGELVGSTAH